MSMNLNTGNWKEFRLGNLFSEMYKAEAHVKADLECFNMFSHNTIKFISRTEMNNGCDCYVLNNDLTGIEEGNAISIGDTTATCFYQSERFICGDHMVICRAGWLNKYTALFVLSILKQEKYKYSYGRAYKMDLISNTVIKLPATADGSPDWDFMERYIKSLNYKPLTTLNNHPQHLLNIDSWQEFFVSDIFEIYNGKFITKEEIDENPGDFRAVQSGEENNGILGKIDKQYCIDNGYIYTDEPCLTVARSGSAGYVSYQNFGCVVGDSAKILLLKDSSWRTPYIYLFFKTLLMANKFKYTYGRKVTEDKYLNEIIKLPVKLTKEGNIMIDTNKKYSAKGFVPDFEFMENYIKSLPYGDRI